MSAPLTAPTPPTTAKVVTGKLASNRRASVVSVWPDTAPARPAMPADRAKVATLVRVRSRPRVAHATGLSFIADRRRPHAPRRSADEADADQPERQRQHADLPEGRRHLERAEFSARHLPVVARHDRRLEEHQLVHEDGERRPSRAPGRCPGGGAPAGRRGHRRWRSHRDRDDRAKRLDVGPDHSRHDAADPGEGDLRQRDLPGVPGERDERQRHQAKNNALDHEEAVDRLQQRRDADRAEDDGDGAERRWAWSAWPGAAVSGRRSAASVAGGR